MIARILKEPLLHFLVIGVLLFAIRDDDGSSRPGEIVVDQARLLSYLQYQSGVFDAGRAAAELDRMSVEQRDALVRSYVDEEILYREARANGLDRGDEVIRRRLVQNARLLIASDRADLPQEDELRSYYAAHRDRYVAPASVTFTHVFFDAALRGADGERFALDAVRRLNRTHATFADAPGHGDRFPYLVNYVDRSADFLASHFGAAMSERLMTLEPSVTHWSGPYRSIHGWHAVLLTRRTEARQLGLEEVREELTDAVLEEHRLTARREALEALRGKYEVKVLIERPEVREGG